MHVTDHSVKLYADGAELNGMIEMAKNIFINGLTANPNLLRKTGKAYKISSLWRY